MEKKAKKILKKGFFTFLILFIFTIFTYSFLLTNFSEDKMSIEGKINPCKYLLSEINNEFFEINYQNIEIKVFFDKKKLYLSGWETIDAYNNSVFTDIIIYEVNKIVNNNLFNLKEFY